jgi:predicted transcriptional regulator
MSEKRSRLRIIYDILNMIRNNNNSIKPTPLLRYSNLSSQSFSSYLGELMEKGFVEEKLDRKGKKILVLTENGFNYLQKYKAITKFVQDFNL